MTTKVKKTYGIKLKPRKTVRPAKISLAGEEGSRIVRAAAERVIKIHTDVLKALAKR